MFFDGMTELEGWRVMCSLFVFRLGGRAKFRLSDGADLMDKRIQILTDDDDPGTFEILLVDHCEKCNGAGELFVNSPNTSKCKACKGLGYFPPPDGKDGDAV